MVWIAGYFVLWLPFNDIRLSLSSHIGGPPPLVGTHIHQLNDGSYFKLLWMYFFLLLRNYTSLFETVLHTSSCNISRAGPLLAPQLPTGFLCLEGQLIGLPYSPGMWVCNQIIHHPLATLVFDTHLAMLESIEWAVLVSGRDKNWIW